MIMKKIASNPFTHLFTHLTSMTKKCFLITLSSVFLLSSSVSIAAVSVLAGWDVHSLTGGTNSFGASPFSATSSDANLAVGGLTRGAGVLATGSAAARGWGGNDWVSASAISAVSANDFVTFSLTANPGYQVSFSSISKFDYRRSGTGPANGILQYQVDNGSFVDITSITYSSTAAAGASIAAINLSGITALQNINAGATVTFRVVNYGGTSNGGTWYFYDVSNSSASDIEVSGTVSVTTASQDGVCGSANTQSLPAAPTSNLCGVGNASAVAGTGSTSSPWTWNCSGANGGNSTTCSATSSDAGVCL
jgi:hypothetical protein